MQHYKLNGITLSTEVVLRTLSPVATGAEPDQAICFRIQDSEDPPRSWRQLYTIPLKMWTGEERPFLTVKRAVDGYHLRFHGYADFVVDAAGSDVCCTPLADCPIETIEQLLVDQILPRTMQLRGSPCFHASAAYIEQLGVVAVMGGSGAGKSTLCAALCKHGSLVADDCMAVRVEDKLISVFAGYPSVRLWPASARAVVGDTNTLERATPRLPKLRVKQPLGTEGLALERIILLEPVAEGPARMRRLAASQAVAQLTRCLFRLDPECNSQLDNEFRLLTEVAARVGVYQLHLPHVFEQLPEVVQLVTSDLS